MLPQFLIKKVPKQQNIRKIRTLINNDLVHTVCESASCPNIGECFSRQTLTFMILGNICTRNCAFCGIAKGKPLPPDPAEPEKIAQAVQNLGLNYVVITSVTRDDLPDGGAGQFALTIRNLRLNVAVTKIEVLVPDFNGNIKSLKTVLDANPYVLNHNIETIPRLYAKIRPEADFGRSLQLLRRAKEFDRNIYTKSGFMVGLGETREEVLALLAELKAARVDIVTIGQYLPPSRQHLRPERYVDPKEFWDYEGFEGLKVVAGPFVRSSYQAKEVVA